MSWQILLAASIILGSLATILQKVLMKDDKSNPAALAIFFQIIMAVFVLILALFTGGLDFADVFRIIPNLVIMTFLIGPFYLFIFRSLALIDASEFIVILATRPLFTILASTVFLGEGLTAKQFLGVVLILVSITIVTMDHFKIHFGKGEFFAILAAAAVGFANTNDRIVLQSFPLVPYLLLSAILPMVFLTMMEYRSVPKIKEFLKPKKFLKTLLMAFFQFAMIITFLGALKVGQNSSQIASMGELNIILTVLLSVILLKERKNLVRKLAGAGLSFIGLILTA